jgi:type II secretion system protein H
MRISRPGNTAGFSLFELLVVLVLLSVAAAVVIPSFSGALASLELETATRDLVTRMRGTRTRSVAQQKVFRIVLRTEPGQPAEYVVTDDYGKELKNYPMPRGISYVVDEEALPLTISFFPNGRSSGGVFGLKNEKGKTLYVKVDSISGLGRMVRTREEDGSG